MGYYKASIGKIVEGTAPKEKRPKFELTEKQIEVIKTVSGAVLAVTMVAGIIVLSAIAPNIFVALDKIFGGKRSKVSWSRNGSNRAKVTKSIYYLKSREYIELIPQGEDFLVKITQKGRKQIRKFQIDALKLQPLDKWDKRWWVLVADVPVEYRRRADYFREKLKELGLYRLQKTVWFYPFDMRDEIDFVAAYYRVHYYATIMRADVLDPADEEVLKKYFKKNKII